MRRRHTVIASAAAAALAGGLLLAPSAQADPSLCIDLDISIQGEGAAESICLPPEDGGETPELPGLPEPPGLEDPGLPGLPTR